ncbi:class I SAM-dependent methyltransferase [Arthrobacter sp. H14]|uniref:class I SAM-dependent methyltransferase n=1 Tax=Arthrobacter sp. H14 TaxID=1312959 RepID=UPI00047E33D8|nr:class I SAM-dependent methyltransferase [Arthrobacter sp. H14]
MTDETRWERPDHAGIRKQFEDRFRQMHDEGTDTAGEARFIDMLLDRGSTVLDAGCGTGRLTAELNLRGHLCIGVDKDPKLLKTAKELHGPGHDFLRSDLVDVTGEWLAAGGLPRTYDLIAAIGNVMAYLAPGSEIQVLRNFAALLTDGGRLVTGFAADRDYTLEQFDDDASAAGFRVEHRFGSWQLAAFDDDADWATTVLRRSGQ